MKSCALAIALVVGVFACGFAGVDARGAAVSEAYSGLRNMALGMKPDMVDQSTSAPSNQPYSVVTDISVDKGIATVVASRDGSASIYLSSGGGYLGGEGNQKVSDAAKAAVVAAASAVREMHSTKKYPLPEHGHVNFYVLTMAGVITATGSEAALRDTSQPLGHLYDAVQNVIAQYRLIRR